MRTMLQLVGGIAAAGVVAAGATAFTATGLATSGTGAAANQFIGGQISQTVTGANLSGIAYSFLDAPTNTQFSSVLLTFSGTFSGAADKTLTITPAGGSLSTATKFYCGQATASDGSGGWATVPTSNTVTCFTADSGNLAAGYFSGLTGLTVKVTPIP
jgi:hypothetical protein